RLCQTGPAPEVVSMYLLSHSHDGSAMRWSAGIANTGETSFAFLGVEMQNDAGVPSNQFLASERIQVRLDFQIKSLLYGARVGFYVASHDGFVILETYDTDAQGLERKRAPGAYTVSAVIPGQLLNEGRYQLGLNAGIPGTRNLCHLERVLVFSIHRE